MLRMEDGALLIINGWRINPFRQLIVCLFVFILTIQLVFGAFLTSFFNETAISGAVATSPSQQGEFFLLQPIAQKDTDTPRIAHSASYAGLMRAINNQSKQTDYQSTAHDLDQFIDDESDAVKELGVSRKKRNQYQELLKKQFSEVRQPAPSVMQRVARILGFSNQSQPAPSAGRAENDAAEIMIPPKPGSFGFGAGPVEVRSIDFPDSLPVSAPSGDTVSFVDQAKSLFIVAQSRAYEDAYLPALADVKADNGAVAITSDIQELAAGLGYNPVSIYNYVRSIISYEPYYGAKKGSSGCMAEKVCNDVDTASLLIALLRASGIPARYKKSLVHLPVNTLKELLGVDEVKTAYYAFSKNNIPVHVVSGTIGDLDSVNLENEQELVAEWVFAEAFYDYDERGANISNAANAGQVLSFETNDELRSYLNQFPKKQWIPLELFIGRGQVRVQNEIVADSAGFDASAFWSSFFQYQGALSPTEKYRADLLSAASKDVLDEAYQSSHSISLSAGFDLLPSSLPYVAGTGVDSQGNVIAPESWSQLPDERRARVVLSLLSEDGETTLLSQTFFASEVNNQPIILSYTGATQTDVDVIDSYGGIYTTPAPLVDIVPYVEIGYSLYGTENMVKIGDTLILQFTYQEKGQTIYEDQKFSIAGNKEGIFIAFSAIQDDYMLDDNTLTSSERNSRILLRGSAALAREYLKTIQQQGVALSKSLDHSYQTQFSRAVVTQNRALSKVGGVPTTFDFSGLTIDAGMYHNDYSNRGNYKIHQSDFHLLWGLESSYYEGQLFTDVASLSGISTVQGMQYVYAHPETYTIHTITAVNEADIDSLSLSANTKANMHARVQAGNTVITPDRTVEDGAFLGILYVSRGTNGSFTQYAIGEQVANGGWSTDMFDLSAWIDADNQDQYAFQFENGPKMFIMKEDADRVVFCSIKVVTYNQIISGTLAGQWSLAQYGKPCVYDTEEGPYAFGEYRHNFIIATGGAYFQSPTNNYDYWLTNAEIIHRFKQRFPSASLAIVQLFPYWGTFAYENKSQKFIGLYNPDTKAVYAVQTRMYESYISPNQVLDEYVPGVLGYPTSEEAVAAPHELLYETGYFQQFSNGTLYKLYREWWPDDVYAVPGKLNEEHNARGGTGEMGFPHSVPFISALEPNTIFQSFGNAERLSYNADTETVSVLDIFQVVAMNHDLLDLDHEDLIEGLVDGFAEMDIYSAVFNISAGVATGYVVGELLGSLALKVGERGALKLGLRYTPLVGWGIAGVTGTLTALENKPLYNACHNSPQVLIQGKRPAYYCGKLLANGILFGIGIAVDIATDNLNKLGVDTPAARVGKSRLYGLVKDDDAWNRFKSVFIKSKARTKLAETFSKSYITDGDIIFVTGQPKGALERAATTNFGMTRNILTHDFVRAGKISQDELDAIEEMHQWIIKQFGNETFSSYDSMRVEYWKKASEYPRATSLFSAGDIALMASNGKAPGWPIGASDGMNLHHLEPKVKFPQHETNLEDILPIPCSVHQWTHSSIGATYKRWGSLNVSSQCGL